MHDPKNARRLRSIVLGVLFLLLAGCQQSNNSTETSEQPDATGTTPHAAVGTEGQSSPEVADGFDGDTEPTEQAADQRFKGVSSDVADLLERMESCYSLAADAKVGTISSDEALDLQDQLGCEDIEADIGNSLKQNTDQPKVAQLIQQMKARFKR